MDGPISFPALNKAASISIDDVPPHIGIRAARLNLLLRVFVRLERPHEIVPSAARVVLIPDEK